MGPVRGKKSQIVVFPAEKTMTGFFVIVFP